MLPGDKTFIVVEVPVRRRDEALAEAKRAFNAMRGGAPLIEPPAGTSFEPHWYTDPTAPLPETTGAPAAGAEGGAETASAPTAGAGDSVGKKRKRATFADAVTGQPGQYCAFDKELRGKVAADLAPAAALGAATIAFASPDHVDTRWGLLECQVRMVEGLLW